MSDSKAPSGTWRVRTVSDDQLEETLNAAEAEGFTIMNLMHFESGLTSGRLTTMVARKFPEGPATAAGGTCETQEDSEELAPAVFAALVQELTALRCFQDAFYEADCGVCLPCRARAVVGDSRGGGQEVDEN